MMRNFLLLLVLLGSLATPGFAASAKAKQLGLGFILFSPTGFSAKYFLESEKAWDAAIGWSADGIHIHSDYLLLKNDIYIEKNVGLNLHYGLGCRLFIAQHADDLDTKRADNTNRNNVGFRLPVGLDVMVPKSSIEIFSDLALVINFLVATSADLELALGARYYF